MKKIFFFGAIFICMVLPLASAVYNITGYVEDAKDGTFANGHEIVLWNPLNGQSDNLTDIIGPAGNSGSDNAYLIDCELLSTPCNLGDTLYLKIFNNGDNYVSETQGVFVGGTGSDLVNNLSLNSPPNASAIFPNTGDFFSGEINFNCSAEDLDSNLFEISLYGNWSGVWGQNETQSISGANDFFEFTKNLSEGNYLYGCMAEDNLSVQKFSENKSFVVDLTMPTISSINANETYLCGANKQVKIDCTAEDSLSGISEVWVQAENGSFEQNYSATFDSENNYSSNILLESVGTWNFSCWANDSAGNINNYGEIQTEVYYEEVNLFVESDKIIFNKSNPVEKEIVGINLEIKNLGCSDSGVFLIGLYKGDPDSSGESLENKTFSLSNLSTAYINFSWESEIGANEVFLLADANYSIIEGDESDNKANKTFFINSWQELYGNVSLEKILGYGGSKVSSWDNWNISTGNIFIVDIESSVDWLSLQSIGRDVSGGVSSNDFLEIDQILGMDRLNDSISNIFTNSQIPKNTTSIIIHENEILNVPVIESTLGSEFETGILWDSSDDLGSNNEYDSVEKEDIVFVTPLKKDSLGKYGIYDYESRVPAKLREYYNVDVNEFYLYYDLN